MDNNLLETSDVHAYYSRNKEEDTQAFIPPLSKDKYTDEEIELLEEGIKKIDMTEALSLVG